MKKPIYRGDCQEKEAWALCKFKREFGKKEWVVFLR